MTIFCALAKDSRNLLGREWDFPHLEDILKDRFLWSGNLPCWSSVNHDTSSRSGQFSISLCSISRGYFDATCVFWAWGNDCMDNSNVGRPRCFLKLGHGHPRTFSETRSETAKVHQQILLTYSCYMGSKEWESQSVRWKNRYRSAPFASWWSWQMRKEAFGIPFSDGLNPLLYSVVQTLVWGFPKM